MIQTEILFFWPLTEQISLGLDFSDCDTRKPLYTTYNGGSVITSVTGGSWGTSAVFTEINPTKLTVDVEQVVFKQKTPPTWYRRIIYKIIGINWELK